MNYQNPFGDIRYADNSFYDPTRGYQKAWSPAQASGDAEAECVARGGTWDPVNKVCMMPNRDSEDSTTAPTEQGVMDLPGQALQAYNPDINYENAYQASNGQLVGTIDSGLHDPYNSGPTASASDFRIGSSNSPTDYSTAYALPDGAGDLRQNQNQAVSNIGYDIGEVDPRLAQAAGYKQQASVEDAMTNGNYGVALDLGATPEEIEASGGPSVPVIAKIISNIIGGGPIAGIIKAITGVSLKDSIQNSALRGKILDTISSEFKSSWKDSGYQPGEGTGLAGKPLEPGDPGYTYTDISGGAGQSTDLANWYLGTGKWESQHPTDISHNQQYGSDNPGYGKTNESGLGRDFNYDRFGNRRTSIPTGIKPGSAYWNSTTGAWTDKKSGVPLGGSVNKKDDGGSKAPAADNRDRESAGQKAQKAANRAQLSNNVAKTKASTTSKTYDGWGENDGGFIPAWKSHVKPAYNSGGKVGFGTRLNKGGSVPMFANDGSMANHPFDREGEQFDTVDAVLTPGEFVIDADSTHVFKNVLEKINEWEPGDNPSLGGLLSKKGEKMTITKDLGNGRKMNITSGEEDDLMMADAEAMLATEAQPQQLNIGGLLQSLTGGAQSTAPTSGFDAQRGRARNAAASERRAGLLGGGINSLGRGQDSSAAQIAGAGMRTNSTGSWGPNGYQGASFSQNTPGKPDFSGQANAIGQGFQEAANADADLASNLNAIDAAELSQENTLRSEARADKHRAEDKAVEAEAKKKKISDSIQTFENLADDISATISAVGASAGAWETYRKAKKFANKLGFGLTAAGANSSAIDNQLDRAINDYMESATVKGGVQNLVTSSIKENVADFAGALGISIGEDAEVAPAELTQAQYTAWKEVYQRIRRLAQKILDTQTGTKTDFDAQNAADQVADLSGNVGSITNNLNVALQDVKRTIAQLGGEYDNVGASSEAVVDTPADTSVSIADSVAASGAAPIKGGLLDQASETFDNFKFTWN